MSPSARQKPAARPDFQGPLDWRRMVEWLSEDGVIAADEAQRTIARCSQAESAQPPLVRLAADDRPDQREAVAPAPGRDLRLLHEDGRRSGHPVILGSSLK